MLLAKALWSPILHLNPFFLFLILSIAEPTFVVTIGTPHAIASNKPVGPPSSLEEIKYKSRQLYKSGKSSNLNGLK